MEICTIRSRAELTAPAAEWFASKWGIPAVEYSSSMAESALCRSAVPQVVSGHGRRENRRRLRRDRNDFHDRRDLAPIPVRAVRRAGIPRPRPGGGAALLRGAGLGRLGTGTLYLITEHDSFYERYGWEYLCTAHPEDGGWPLRLYVQKTPE